MNNHCPIPIMRFRPDADGLERWLGPLEAAIMEVVYEATYLYQFVRRYRRH
mgnify:CR=1 FL=1